MSNETDATQKYFYQELPESWQNVIWDRLVHKAKLEAIQNKDVITDEQVLEIADYYLNTHNYMRTKDEWLRWVLDTEV